jgi:tetratricopeptide (TPR) repeat protein
VRAVVDGKTYWLDGTRIGDGSLEAAPVPAFEWGLPLREWAGLAAIERPAPDKPLSENLIRYDASGGLDAPAKLHVEQVSRGDAALISHTQLAAKTTEEQDKWLREHWEIFYDEATIESTRFTWDAQTGELRLILDGTTKMDWKAASAGKPRRYQADRAYLGGGNGLEREDGPGKDAPVEVDFPHFDRDSVSIVLPRQGKGFSISGEAIDKTLAGHALKRSFSLKDGVFTMEAVDRTLSPEVSVAEVLAAEAELERLGDTTVYVLAPQEYKATDDDVTSAKDGAPKTVDEYMARATRLSGASQYAEAIADADAALKLDPKSAKAMTLRGATRALMQDEDGAMADFDAALVLDRRDTAAHSGRAGIFMARKDYASAIAAWTRVLDIDPVHATARQMRGNAYFVKGDKELGLDDAMANAALQPDSMAAALFLGQAYAGNGQEDKALETLRAAAEKWSDDGDMQAEMAMALWSCRGREEVCAKRRVEAVQFFDKAIALKPSVKLYVDRAQARPQSDRAGKYADLDAALALQPDSDAVLLARASTYLAYDDLEPARRDVETVIARDPSIAGAYYTLGMIHEKRGNFAAQIQAADSALKLAPDYDVFQNAGCWARAIAGRELGRALELCNASLATSPAPNTYDSRALVHLRMGSLDAAIADYDVALSAAPYATGLYGRGIAKLQKGLTKAGKADLKAARKLDKTIDATFAGYGITPPDKK